MTEVIAAMGDVLGLVGTAVGVITGEPILLFFLAAGLVPIGFEIFKAAKGAAQG